MSRTLEQIDEELAKLDEKASTKAPEPPGFEIDNDAYHALPGESNSKLSTFIRDPRQYHYEYLSGEFAKESKSHFDFGTAVNDLVLLGHNPGLVVIPDDVLSNGAKRGKAWTEFAEAHEGEIMLKPGEFKAVENCAAAIKADPMAGELLKSGWPERAFTCRDEERGLDLRCKVDWLRTAPAGWIVVDLKTNGKSTSVQKVAYAMDDFGYARQGYFYRKVLAANGIELAEFVFAFVHTDPPHHVDCYRIDEDFRNQAQDEVERALDGIANCKKSGKWVGEGHGKIISVGPPRNAKYKRQYEL